MGACPGFPVCEGCVACALAQTQQELDQVRQEKAELQQTADQLAGQLQALRDDHTVLQGRFTRLVELARRAAAMGVELLAVLPPAPLEQTSGAGRVG